MTKPKEKIQTNTTQKIQNKCPQCGKPMEITADWPDEWLYCPNCLHTEKILILEY